MAADGNDLDIRELYARTVVLEVTLTHVMLALVSSTTSHPKEDTIRNLLLPVEKSLRAACARATPETAQSAHDALDLFEDYSRRLFAALAPTDRTFVDESVDQSEDANRLAKRAR